MVGGFWRRGEGRGGGGLDEEVFGWLGRETVSEKDGGRRENRAHIFCVYFNPNGFVLKDENWDE